MLNPDPWTLNVKGKYLPRKAKKAHRKQVALAAQLMERAGGKALGHATRARNMGDVNVDVERALGAVGAACDGGRKGALKLLSGGADVRQSKHPTPHAPLPKPNSYTASLFKL
jgi:hypothetical protein